MFLVMLYLLKMTGFLPNYFFLCHYTGYVSSKMTPTKFITMNKKQTSWRASLQRGNVSNLSRDWRRLGLHSPSWCKITVFTFKVLYQRHLLRLERFLPFVVLPYSMK